VHTPDPDLYLREVWPSGVWNSVLLQRCGLQASSLEHWGDLLQGSKLRGKGCREHALATCAHQLSTEMAVEPASCE
jgi:hypothetical protein